MISKSGASVEVEVPPIARKAPVADIGDLPVGRRFEVDDEIHTTTIRAADLTPAEGHPTTVPSTTDLPRREPERDQDRIKGLRNQARTTLSRPRWNRAWFNPRLSLAWLARPWHDWWMVSEAGPTRAAASCSPVLDLALSSQRFDTVEDPRQSELEVLTGIRGRRRPDRVKGGSGVRKRLVSSTRAIVSK